MIPALILPTEADSELLNKPLLEQKQRLLQRGCVSSTTFFGIVWLAKARVAYSFIVTFIVIYFLVYIHGLNVPYATFKHDFLAQGKRTMNMKYSTWSPTVMIFRQ